MCLPMKAGVKSHRGVPAGSPHIVCESYVRTGHVHIGIKKQDSCERTKEERRESWKREERGAGNERREREEEREWNKRREDFINAE